MKINCDCVPLTVGDYIICAKCERELHGDDKVLFGKTINKNGTKIALMCKTCAEED